MARWGKLVMEVDYRGEVWERSVTTDGRQLARIERSFYARDNHFYWVIRTYDLVGGTSTNEVERGRFYDRVLAEAFFRKHSSRWLKSSVPSYDEAYARDAMNFVRRERRE